MTNEHKKSAKVSGNSTKAQSNITNSIINASAGKVKRDCYPNSDVCVSDPFFIFECVECNSKSWCMRHIDYCPVCKSTNEKSRCHPANEK